MGKLTGKSAVITGASSGIGRAIALAFASEGARLVVNYKHSQDKADELVGEIEGMGGQAVAVRADVADENDVMDLVVRAREFLTDIDIWINNAGADILTGRGAELEDTKKLSLLIDVDMKGTINSCWRIAPLMKERGGGVILNMSWDLSIHGFHGRNPQMFSAVKAGILGFSKSLAWSYAPEVRVNVLAPGWIETSFAEQQMEREYYQARIEEIPMRRFGKPVDVAAAAVFLASDEAAYITGQVININGGTV
ncbi:MAG: SDR family oxidoreductase [Gammaproteobacteria bacterium]